MPFLALAYYAMVPDLPVFGFTVVPETRKYSYTFSSLAITIDAFLDAIGVKRIAVYIPTMALQPEYHLLSRGLKLSQP